MRRATNPTRKISITIPNSLFQQLNHHLSYDQSRSGYISSAIAEKMQKDDTVGLDQWTKLDLVEELVYRVVKDSPEDVLLQSLLQILSK